MNVDLEKKQTFFNTQLNIIKEAGTKKDFDFRNSLL